ncbi:MAG: rubrerythrin family protein [Candidatus Hydrogenedens sp.]|jgi:rubrerythrin|nr:rubrerythrin family protein [Candidatus Hydrogenedens sp.]
MSTKDNLMAAFAGESQASRKYLAFAKKAEQDNFKQVGRLFRAASAAETIHAHAHLRALGAIKSTLENLEEAKAGEEYEFESMYPAFVTEAIEEGNQAALVAFKHAMAAENIHAGLYGEAIEAVKAGEDLPETAIHVCEICGNTVFGEAPDKCQICGVPKERFFAIE